MRRIAITTLLCIPLSSALLRCGGNPEVGARIEGIDTDAGSGGATGTDSGTGGFIGIGGNGGDESDGGGMDGGDMTGCGNGRIEPGEVCDDGNSEGGDGCSAACDQVEQDFACPTPGSPCVSTVTCGDGRIGGEQTCDDGNTRANDGCDGDCMIQPGWVCPVPNARCEAAACGDGIIAGNEECEDDDQPPSDDGGCTETCRLKDGYVCETPGEPCRVTVCNDGVEEGSEPCDDGNLVIGDGCNPFCEVEPNCSARACVSACGDGIILPGDDEECDDGNTRDNDGCSSTCTVEDGWMCTKVTGELPDTLEVPVTYRDFNRSPTSGNTRHPDFEAYSGDDATPGMVEESLGANGKPVYTGICERNNRIGPCPHGDQTTSEAAFNQWYSNTHPADLTLVTRMSLGRVGQTEAYRTPAGSLFPLDSFGHVAAGEENAHNGHNFGFTSEIRNWFEFKGGEQLDFSGDDDVWVFVAGKLVLDLGGLHPRRTGGFELNADGSATWSRLMQDPDPVVTETGDVDLGLVVGRVYEMVLFHAERHTGQSNFELTLTGFVKAQTECVPRCGDGIVVADEVCDDGVNDGSYGSCTPDCRLRGPYCGDKEVQSPDEECDDGINLTSYGMSEEPACAPGCQLSPYCGDGEVNSLFGERCDDGTNDGGYGECNPGCVLGPRCGDGVTQEAEGETCDDGNTVSGDGCSSRCLRERPR